MEIWDGFKGTNWKNEINVFDFIINNYTEYVADASFLKPVTAKTEKLLKKYEKLAKRELDIGVLDIDTYNIASINSFEKGYLDYKNEVLYGFQTDECLKRIANLYSGNDSVIKSIGRYGYHVDKDILNNFKQFRKTHDQATFQGYSDDIKKAIDNKLLVGLPDEYSRGKITGDYRRIALYGVDYLVKVKEKDLQNLENSIDDKTIRLREEINDQIEALEQMRKMALRYDFDISRPAANAFEAIQWIYFGYLANVKQNNGMALSFGRNMSFIDIYIERDLRMGIITEEQAQELIDQLILKLRAVRHVRSVECDDMFGKDTNIISIPLAGMLNNGHSLVTKSDYRVLNSLLHLGIDCEPYIEVLWSNKLPIDFKNFCSDIAIKTNLIRFSNDELIREVYGEDYAISTPGSAFKYGKQIQLFGSSINLMKVLMYAINGGRDEITHELVIDGIEIITDEYLSIEIVLKNFEKALKKAVKIYVDALNIVHYMGDKYNYESLAMALNDSKVERLMEFGITGLPNLIDSLSAITSGHVRVKRDADDITKSFDIEREFYRYGSGYEGVNLLVSKVVNRVYKEISKYDLYRDAIATLSTNSFNLATIYGNSTGTTPDCRKAGLPLTPEACSLLASDRSSFDMFLNTLKVISYKSCLGGIVGSVNLDPMALGTEESKNNNLSHIVDTWILNGLQHLNINIIDRDVLVNARTNPSKYQNLVFKYYGCNLKFISLDRVTQESILYQTFFNKIG